MGSAQRNEPRTRAGGLLPGIWRCRALRHRGWILTAVASASAVTAASAQVFELREVTWGPLEHRAQPGPGLVEMVAALLILQALALAGSVAILIRKSYRLRRWAGHIDDHPDQRVALVEAKQREDRMVFVFGFVLAPIVGVLGALLGRGFSLWQLSVSALLTAGAISILMIHAVVVILGTREHQILARLPSSPRSLW